jgi:hypothetical protein
MERCHCRHAMAISTQDGAKAWWGGVPRARVRGPQRPAAASAEKYK